MEKLEIIADSFEELEQKLKDLKKEFQDKKIQITKTNLTVETKNDK